ncbi:Ccdc68 [Columba livia]|nr:Ccdc68 [Columba livia]
MLIEKKTSFEKTLHQMMARNEDSKRCRDVEQQIVTLREQICHLQRLIQAQQHGLRAVIQEAEELNKELKSQDKRIEDLTEKLTALEAQNKELKDRVEFWSGKPKTMVSKGVWTDIAYKRFWHQRSKVKAAEDAPMPTSSNGTSKCPRSSGY